MTSMELPSPPPPDLERGRRFLATHPPPGRLLLCAVTGSHVYGFSSPDSDLDLKGIHLAPTRDLLGLGVPAESFDRLQVFEGLECDLTTNEAARALGLMLRGNGNMLERILSPIQLCDDPATPALQALARGSLSRRCFSHYAGFFRGARREHLRAPRAKAMLYTWRVALTGIHLLRSGALEMDLVTLALAHGPPEVLELIAWKRSTDEKTPLDPALDAALRDGWAALDEALVDARDRSPLPPAPTNRADCEAWLIEARLSAV